MAIPKQQSSLDLADAFDLPDVFGDELGDAPASVSVTGNSPKSGSTSWVGSRERLEAAMVLKGVGSTGEAELAGLFERMDHQVSTEVAAEPVGSDPQPWMRRAGRRPVPRKVQAYTTQSQPDSGPNLMGGFARVLAAAIVDFREQIAKQPVSPASWTANDLTDPVAADQLLAIGGGRFESGLESLALGPLSLGGGTRSSAADGVRIVRKLAANAVAPGRDLSPGSVVVRGTLDSQRLSCPSFLPLIGVGGEGLVDTASALRMDKASAVPTTKEGQDRDSDQVSSSAETRIGLPADTEVDSLKAALQSLDPRSSRVDAFYRRVALRQSQPYTSNTTIVGTEPTIAAGMDTVSGTTEALSLSQKVFTNSTALDEVSAAHDIDRDSCLGMLGSKRLRVLA